MSPKLHDRLQELVNQIGRRTSDRAHNVEQARIDPSIRREALRSVTTMTAELDALWLQLGLVVLLLISRRF